MKFKTALALAVLTLSSVSFAQTTTTTNSGNDLSGDRSKPGGIDLGGVLGTGVQVLISRFHTIEVDGLARDIEASGKTTREYVAAFSASGRLLSLDEAEGDSEDIEKILGKNVGAQFIPFTVKVIPATGDYSVQFNGVSFKNMNSYVGAGNWQSCGGYYSTNCTTPGFWTIVDKLDVAIFKFDRGMTFQNMESFDWRVVDFDAKLDILGSKKPGRYLAITAGGNIGGGNGSILMDNGQRIYYSDKSDSIHGGTPLAYSYRAGLEYGDDLGKVRLTARAGMTGTGFGNDLHVYNPTTELGGKATFNSMYLNPSLDVSTKVSGKGKKPVRIGLGIGANLPINHTLSSPEANVNINMGNMNKNKYTARLVITF